MMSVYDKFSDVALARSARCQLPYLARPDKPMHHETMKLVAVEQAEERLTQARRALQCLSTKGNRAARESGWIDLITALGTVYSKLEQGAKGNGRSEAWFGRKKSERKTDPLLAYLHQARNNAEHGIDRSASYAKQAVSFSGMLKPGTMAGLQSTPQGMRPFSTDPDLELRFVEDDVHLLTVKNRGVLYHPPTEHLSAALNEFGASHVGAMAVRYVEKMVAEARTHVA